MTSLSAVLAELVTKRNLISAAIAGLEPLIAIDAAPVNGRAAPTAASRPKPKPAKRPKAAVRRPVRKPAPAKASSPTGAGGADLEKQILRLRSQGKRPAEIAAALKVPIWKVYGVRQLAPDPAGLRWRCAECGQTGVSDPCEHCGEAR